MKTVGTRLREIRENNDFPQRKVAELLGVQRPNYSKIENDKQGLTPNQIKLFCEFFKVSADYILDIHVDNKETMPAFKKDSIRRRLETILQELE